MNLTLTPTHVEVQLSTIERIGALRRARRIPRDAVVRARVDTDPLRSIQGSLKIGLRIPGRRFVCVTGLGRHFWAIRRGAPAVHLALADTGRRLREVTVSADDAERIVRELAPRAAVPA